MSLQTVLIVVAALISGVVVGLKVVAPLTANTTDDEVLKRLEALERLLQGLANK